MAREKWRCRGLSIQNQRLSNMDCILFRQRSTAQGAALLAVVCDGVGSTRDGAFAATYCAASLAQWFHQAETLRLGLDLRDQVLALNEKILLQAKAEGLDTATTLSALLLMEEQYVTVHIGDSRIYYHNGKELIQLTQDDNSSQGKLTGCIGRWQNILPHYGEGTAEDGVFLLCSDGLYKCLSREVLALEVARSFGRSQRRVLKRLSREAIAAGSRDNISVILVQQRKRGSQDENSIANRQRR